MVRIKTCRLTRDPQLGDPLAWLNLTLADGRELDDVALHRSDCLIKRAASGLDGVPSRFGGFGDMRTNAQPASRNERITWITSPSCRTAMGRPQRRKTFSMGRLRESTSASSRSRPFTRAMAMI